MHLTGISLIEFVMIPREEASLWDKDEWKRYSSWERQRNQQGVGRLPPLSGNGQKRMEGITGSCKDWTWILGGANGTVLARGNVVRKRPLS